MNPVTLPPSHVLYQVELTELLDKIESELKKPVDQTNGEQLAWHLQARLEMLGTTPRVMELAILIHATAKGMASEEAFLSDKVLSLKQEVQKKWFDGKLSPFDALYEKADRLSKNLVHSIEGLRTLISREKELIRSNIFQQR